MTNEPIRASDLIALLQKQIDEHGDGYAQISAFGNWLPVTAVKSWHGRTLIEHEAVALFPFHKRDR